MNIWREEGVDRDITLFITDGWSIYQTEKFKKRPKEYLP
jgi:hypothetical protein